MNHDIQLLTATLTRIADLVGDSHLIGVSFFLGGVEVQIRYEDFVRVFETYMVTVSGREEHVRHVDPQVTVRACRRLPDETIQIGGERK